MLRTVVIAKSFYGFKAHVEITYDGYIINYVITKASVHDTVETLELITSSPYYQLLVDIGYVGKDLHDFLKNNYHNFPRSHRILGMFLIVCRFQS